MFAYEEDFEDVEARNDGKFRDARGSRCAHEVRDDGGDQDRRMHGVNGWRIVAAPAHRGECHPACDLGFTTYYVDSLGSDGTDPFHKIGQGAPVGVESVPDGEHAYALRLQGVHGMVVMCSRPIEVTADYAVASARVHVAAPGWHDPSDELRVWVDVSGSRTGDNGGVSLLPQCAPVATADDVDALGLRSSNSSWQWRNLSVALGALERASVRVCTGLQSRLHSEAAVFVGAVGISGGGGDGAPATQSPAQRCAPSPVLVGVSSLSALAVPGSCHAVPVVGMVIAGAILAAVLVVAYLCQRPLWWLCMRWEAWLLAVTTPAAPLIEASDEPGRSRRPSRERVQHRNEWNAVQVDVKAATPPKARPSRPQA